MDSFINPIGWDSASQTTDVDTPESNSTLIAYEGRALCATIPVAPNNSFFGREDILDEIEQRLQPRQTDGARSVALHGLGGVEKTQIALRYPYSKVGELDVVLWVDAADPDSAGKCGDLKLRQVRNS